VTSARLIVIVPDPSGKPSEHHHILPVATSQGGQVTRSAGLAVLRETYPQHRRVRASMFAGDLLVRLVPRQAGEDDIEEIEEL